MIPILQPVTAKPFPEAVHEFEFPMLLHKPPSRGGVQSPGLWVGITGFRDACSPHTDSALNLPGQMLGYHTP